MTRHDIFIYDDYGGIKRRHVEIMEQDDYFSYGIYFVLAVLFFAAPPVFLAIALLYLLGKMIMCSIRMTCYTIYYAILFFMFIFLIALLAVPLQKID